MTSLPPVQGKGSVALYFSSCFLKQKLIKRPGQRRSVGTLQEGIVWGRNRAVLTPPPHPCLLHQRERTGPAAHRPLDFREQWAPLPAAHALGACGWACFPARPRLLYGRGREAGHLWSPSSLTSLPPPPQPGEESLRVPSIPEVLQNISGNRWPSQWASVPAAASAPPCPWCSPAC